MNLNRIITASLIVYLTASLNFLFAQGSAAGPVKTKNAVRPARENTTGWRMHHIDNPQVELPNGLDVADVNKDNFPDYVTNYEGGAGDVRVAFHPGKQTRFSSPELAARQLWPSVRVCKYLNAESACFGDVDGDGNPDVIVAHGNQAGVGHKSGVSVIWHPGVDKVMEEKAWLDGGDVPATISKGHYLYVKTLDVDGDGALDIVVGGRREGSSARNPSKTGVLAGIKWIQSPGGSTEQRRDLSKWTVYDINAEWFSGHGFVLADIDSDGDIDIADGNEDWDTPKGAEEVAWFENPGQGSPRQKKPWEKQGQPLGTFYGYIFDGIYQNAEEVADVNRPGAVPGSVRFVDVNGDGVISPDDQTIIGDPNPDFIYGLTNNFSFKGFDLSILIQGVEGGDILNLTRARLESAGRANSLKSSLNYWRGENTSNTIEALGQFNGGMSTRFLEDGSYLRVKNIVLGYTFPADMLERVKVRNLRIYVSAVNPITLTNYSGFDPEVNMRGNNNLLMGIDHGGFPVFKTYTMGINLGF